MAEPDYTKEPQTTTSPLDDLSQLLAGSRNRNDDLEETKGRLAGVRDRIANDQPGPQIHRQQYDPDVREPDPNAPDLGDVTPDGDPTDPGNDGVLDGPRGTYQRGMPPDASQLVPSARDHLPKEARDRVPSSARQANGQTLTPPTEMTGDAEMAEPTTTTTTTTQTKERQQQRRQQQQQRQQRNRRNTQRNVEMLDAQAAQSKAPLHSLGLNVRTERALKQAGLATVGAVAAQSAKGLLKIKNFGPKGLAEVQAKMAQQQADQQTTVNKSTATPETEPTEAPINQGSGQKDPNEEKEEDQGRPEMTPEDLEAEQRQFEKEDRQREADEAAYRKEMAERDRQQAVAKKTKAQNFREQKRREAEQQKQQAEDFRKKKQEEHDRQVAEQEQQQADESQQTSATESQGQDQPGPDSVENPTDSQGNPTEGRNDTHAPTDTGTNPSDHEPVAPKGDDGSETTTTTTETTETEQPKESQPREKGPADLTRTMIAVDMGAALAKSAQARQKQAQAMQVKVQRMRKLAQSVNDNGLTPENRVAMIRETGLSEKTLNAAEPALLAKYLVNSAAYEERHAQEFMADSGREMTLAAGFSEGAKIKDPDEAAIQHAAVQQEYKQYLDDLKTRQESVDATFDEGLDRQNKMGELYQKDPDSFSQLTLDSHAGQNLRLHGYLRSIEGRKNELAQHREMLRAKVGPAMKDHEQMANVEWIDTPAMAAAGQVSAKADIKDAKRGVKPDAKVEREAAETKDSVPTEEETTTSAENAEAVDKAFEEYPELKKRFDKQDEQIAALTKEIKEMRQQQKDPNNPLSAKFKARREAFVESHRALAGTSTTTIFGELAFRTGRTVAHVAKTAWDWGAKAITGLAMANQALYKHTEVAMGQLNDAATQTMVQGEDPAVQQKMQQTQNQAQNANRKAAQRKQEAGLAK